MKYISVGTYRPTEYTLRRVGEVLDSRRLSYGPLSKEFEVRFSRLHNRGYGVLSNSGTSALLVALQSLKEIEGWMDGDEVLIPATTFVATVNVVLQSNLVPVLVDIEPGMYGIDVEKMEAAITDRTVAIIPVHLFGQPCDMSQVMSIAMTYGLTVIEDSCETVAARHHGYPAGAWGDVGCFSFYVAHHVVAGVGGMSLTDDPDLAQKMRSYVNHGIDVSQLPGGQDYDPSWLSREFRFTSVGHSFRISELDAAVGLGSLEDISEMILARRKNATFLKHLIDFSPMKLPVITHQLRPDTEHSWMMFPLEVREGPSDEIRAYLGSRGIETRSALPLVSQPVYRGLWDPGDFPVAHKFEQSGFYVGCHQELDLDDMVYIYDSIAEYHKLQTGAAK